MYASRSIRNSRMQYTLFIMYVLAQRVDWLYVGRNNFKYQSVKGVLVELCTHNPIPRWAEAH